MSVRAEKYGPQRALARWMSRMRQDVGRSWRESRSFLLIAVALALGGAALYSAALWWSVTDVNASIEALRTGHDVQVSPDAPPELLLARIAFLTEREEIDRARLFLDALDRRQSDGIRAQGHYLLANALLRKAFDLIERGELDAAGPIVNLTKREYRRSLQLDPQFWNAKFNFDVASRLVRDYPAFEQEEGDVLSADPKKLWTDVPGTPKGLP